ncbi:MAG: cupin domain-containing protein [Alphaproteobacteria bacterium]|nr:cupin domain-containing protein [Alphaproteobacteria bacterium]
MSNPKVIHFEPHGPGDTGLAEWDTIDPGDLEAGNPVQRGHIYHQDEALGYMAGVWDCTAMTGKFEPYAVHEFMFLLEGSVIMVLEDGSEITVNAGEPFVIPKGLPCQWKQPGYIRKYFMIFENPGARAADDVASQGVILPRPSGPPGGIEEAEIGNPSDFIGDLPMQHKHTSFRDPSGQMTVGMWGSTPFETELHPYSCHEFVRLLEGAVTITEEDGATHSFEAGDAFYTPKGSVCAWKTTGYVKKLYAILDPAAG